MEELHSIYERGRQVLEQKGLLSWCDGSAGGTRNGMESSDDLRSRCILWRVLHERFEPDLRTSFGTIENEVPFTPAPIGRLSRILPTAETELVEACSAEGVTVFLSDSLKSPLADLVRLTKTLVVLVLKPSADIAALEIAVRKAEDAGVCVIALNADVLAGLQVGSKVIELHGVGADVPDYYDRVRSLTRLPMFIKGLLHPSEVALAQKEGFSGIILSDYGGRVLPDSASPVEALRAVDSRQVGLDVAVDGGVRSGGDVFKVLALGGRLTLMGQPILYALAAGGGATVQALFRELRRDLQRVCELTDTRDLTNVDSCLLLTSVKDIPE